MASLHTVMLLLEMREREREKFINHIQWRDKAVNRYQQQQPEIVV